MCILIANKSTLLDKETFRNSLDFNPDGFGMMTVIDGVIYHKKYDAKAKFKELYAEYAEWRINSPNTLFLHFRISTSGKIDLDNCHPHKVTNNLYLMHNGILQLDGTKTQSDTARLASLLSKDKDIENSIFEDDSLSSAFACEVAKGQNKLVFLRSDGKTLYINQKQGHKDKAGNWYSNYSYADSFWSNDKTYQYESYSDNFNFYDLNEWDSKKQCYVPKKYVYEKSETEGLA